MLLLLTDKDGDAVGVRADLVSLVVRERVNNRRGRGTSVFLNLDYETPIIVQESPEVVIEMTNETLREMLDMEQGVETVYEPDDEDDEGGEEDGEEG
jgi:hypothetical protein